MQDKNNNPFNSDSQCSMSDTHNINNQTYYTNDKNYIHNNNPINTVFCPRCGFDSNTMICGCCGLDLTYIPIYNNQMNNGFSTKSLPKRDAKLTILIIASVIIGVCMIILLLFFTGNTINKILNNPYLGGTTNEILTPDGEYYDARGVSEKEYEDIQIGMSYAYISSIVGSDGKIVDQGQNLYGMTYYTYLWTGEKNPQAKMYIKFIDSEAVEIVEDGLLS